MPPAYKFLTKAAVQRLLRRVRPTGYELGRLMVDSYVYMTLKGKSLVTNEDIAAIRSKLTEKEEAEFKPFVHLYSTLMYLQQAIESNRQAFLHGAYALESDLNRAYMKTLENAGEGTLLSMATPAGLRGLCAYDPAVAVTHQQANSIRARHEERLGKQVTLLDVYRRAYFLTNEFGANRKRIVAGRGRRFNKKALEVLLKDERPAGHLVSRSSHNGCYVIKKTGQQSPLIAEGRSPETDLSSYRAWQDAAEAVISDNLHLDALPESRDYDVRGDILKAFHPITLASEKRLDLLSEYDTGIEWMDIQPPVTLGSLFACAQYGSKFFESEEGFERLKAEFPEAVDFLKSFILKDRELAQKIGKRPALSDEVCPLRWLMDNSRLGYLPEDASAREESDAKGIIPDENLHDYVSFGYYIKDSEASKEEVEFEEEDTVAAHYETLKDAAYFLFRSHIVIDLINEAFKVDVSPLKPDLAMMKTWQVNLNEKIALNAYTAMKEGGEPVKAALAAIADFPKIDLDSLRHVSKEDEEFVRGRIMAETKTHNPWLIPANYLVAFL